jgi:Flp pilus assembly protein TadD
LYADAIQFYERALLLAPPQAAILGNIATCYAQLGHKDAARLGYQAALELDPTYAVARRNLAILEKVGAQVTT